MTRYIWRDSRFVSRATGEPMLTGGRRIGEAGLPCPSVMPDLPAYASPLGDGMIEGRSARREHLKRNGCRELDPSEFRPSYQSRDERLARAAEQARTLNDRT
jgi:hypothetical protein